MKKATNREIDEVVERIRALNPTQALLGQIVHQEAKKLGIRTRTLARRFPTVQAVWDQNTRESVGLMPEGIAGGVHIERGQTLVTLPVTQANADEVQERWDALRAAEPESAPEPHGSDRRDFIDPFEVPRFDLAAQERLQPSTLERVEVPPMSGLPPLSDVRDVMLTEDAPVDHVELPPLQIAPKPARDTPQIVGGRGMFIGGRGMLLALLLATTSSGGDDVGGR